MANTINSNIIFASDHGNEITKQIKSHVSADFLCNFMRYPEYLYSAINDMSLKPRYFKEDISYLGIPGFEVLTFPMLCFCDIPLSKIAWHMNGGPTEEGIKVDGYGKFGIALNKEKCMERDVQPIRYLNRNSSLTHELQVVFQKLVETEDSIDEKIEFLPDALQRELMFTKPIQGFMSRGNAAPEERNFKDECEWRYIPSIPPQCSLPTFLDSKLATTDGLKYYSNALNNIKELNFSFSVDDIVYLIVPDETNAISLIQNIHSLQKLQNRTEEEWFKLISKIEIADHFSRNLL